MKIQTYFTALFCLVSLGLSAAEIQIKQTIIRPEHYFKTHPEHVIPEGMVIQKFKVKLSVKVKAATGPFTYKFRFRRKKGDAKLLNEKNTNIYGKGNSNTFLADIFGENIIEIRVRKNGKTIAMKREKIVVHFSRTKVGGGDHSKLDPQFGKKHYIKGKVENGKLVYTGLRFFPSIREGIDKRYDGGKYGFYEVTEPRIFRNPKTNTLFASYHAKVKGKNDAPPGQTVIVTRSVDNGTTWTHDQVIDHDVNAVVGYTAFAYYKGKIQIYYAGGHFSHKKATARQGVYRIISQDDGKSWSKPEAMDEMTELVNGKANSIGKIQSPICNTLQIPDMTWKGKKGDAILVGFYIHPVKFLISMDGGKKWDVFFDAAKHKGLESSMNEISWTLLDNRTIYVVSRRQSKKGYKNELLFDLKGNVTYLGQDRKNHLARRCHHGAVKITSGSDKGRVVLVNHYKVDREDATIALSETPKALKFETRYLTYGAAWGYCDVLWNPKTKGLVIIGESEPFDEVTEKVFRITKAPTRNERFSIQSFQMSLDFYRSLVKVPKI
mgnify:CR=1 FL=1